MVLTESSEPHYKKQKKKLYFKLYLNFRNSLTKLSKKLLTDLDELSTTLLAMGQTFSNLYKISNEFNNSINCGKNRLLDEIYVTLNNTFMNLGNLLF